MIIFGSDGTYCPYLTVYTAVFCDTNFRHRQCFKLLAPKIYPFCGFIFPNNTEKSGQLQAISSFFFFIQNLIFIFLVLKKWFLLFYKSFSVNNNQLASKYKRDEIGSAFKRGWGVYWILKKKHVIFQFTQRHLNYHLLYIQVLILNQQHNKYAFVQLPHFRSVNKRKGRNGTYSTSSKWQAVRQLKTRYYLYNMQNFLKCK